MLGCSKGDSSLTIVVSNHWAQFLSTNSLFTMVVCPFAALYRWIMGTPCSLVPIILAWTTCWDINSSNTKADIFSSSVGFMLAR